VYAHHAIENLRVRRKLEAADEAIVLPVGGNRNRFVCLPEASEEVDPHDLCVVVQKNHVRETKTIQERECVLLFVGNF
jgi:hypothetical protein